MKMKALAITLIALSFWALSKDQAVPSNYVVIGAFSVKEHAIHFTGLAMARNLKAAYDYNTHRKLFYVYVLHTDDRKLAFGVAMKLRSEEGYADAWVFSGILGETQVHEGVDHHPVTEEKMIRIDDKSLPNYDNKSLQSESRKDSIQLTVKEESKTVAAQEAVGDDEKTDAVEDVNGKSKSFFFKIYRSGGEEKIEGEVNVIDKQKKVKTFKGNVPVVMTTLNQSGDLKLECEVFGFRKVTQLVNFRNPSAAEGIQIENNQVIVPFELVRLKRGDLTILYNVYFFQDAAIMRPESKDEMDGLLAMMKENQKYKIRIHGHTNGKAPGKINAMGEGRNFFSLTGAKEGYGSAKKLSEERAKLIMEYLVSEGIDPGRMQLKAWGGKRPIYDKTSNQARANVRVEIEIIEE